MDVARRSCSKRARSEASAWPTAGWSSVSGRRHAAAGTWWASAQHTLHTLHTLQHLVGLGPAEQILLLVLGQLVERDSRV